LAAPAGDVLRAGYGGGFFHPTTGYSLPFAVRLALHVASRSPENPLDGAFVAALRAQQRFCVLLNRLLYRAMPEGERWRVLARFHQLPPQVIARFYSMELTRADRARILCGRPPRGIDLRKAFRELRA
jgi:lycopene beta-cyclase